MAISDEKLAALIGKPASDALLKAGYAVVSGTEVAGWNAIRDKYEFIFSALDMIARKPLRENPEEDANELRYLVEHSLKMVGIVNGATPFDQFRFVIAKQRELASEVIKILQAVLDSNHVDSEAVSAIRSAIEKEIALINFNL